MKLRKYAAYIIAGFSIFLCLFVFRFYLHQTSNQLGREFKAQNISELASSDVYSIATRLNSLSNAINWVCITGTRNGQVFFEKLRGACQSNLWQESVAIFNTNKDLQVQLTIRLPSLLESTFAIFMILQLLLLITIIWSTRDFEKRQAQQEAEKLRLEASLGRMATQVAHDIKSPLSALNVIASDLSEFPEDKRLLLRHAINRIRDIANNLIDKNRESVSNGLLPSIQNKSAQRGCTTHHLPTLIDSLVTEKRTQYRSYPELDINIAFERNSYGLFGCVNSTEFHRVLSNLINNAVEATDGYGSVALSLAGSDTDLFISIADNGMGIPKEILHQLGHRGFTFGKREGSGLGLYHAKTQIESWGGELKVSSEVGRGTKLDIRLPRAKGPNWFPSRISLPTNSSLIILDDDPTIHELWETRLSQLKSSEDGIRITHLSSPDQLLECTVESGALFLIDYEFRSHSLNGLKLIERLRIGQNSILVTSHFENSEVQEQVQSLGARLIPKGIVGFVPIEITRKNPRPTS